MVIMKMVGFEEKYDWDEELGKVWEKEDKLSEERREKKKQEKMKETINKLLGLKKKPFSDLSEKEYKKRYKMLKTFYKTGR